MTSKTCFKHGIPLQYRWVQIGTFVGPSAFCPLERKLR